MASRAEQAEGLRKRAAELKARAQRMEAMDQAAERRRLNHKKVLIGAAVLAAVNDGRLELPLLMKLMDKFCKRKSDRALFGLEAQ
ncbi:mobilization protein [Geothrix alkalitolerans]|uniref:mobilization protein n=1 Tax=Geothrix alkalitolerans TaxID=2922724 RepID=UPI001FAEB8C9|nr:mobilization protein [Geothrix alkalitolerans]